MTRKDEHVTVGIVGGGVAGLTLAKTLEQLGVSYRLWEARDEIAPQSGASIGLQPSGLRVLDQIGVVDQVDKYAVPHDRWEHRDADGTLYCALTALRHYKDLIGYEPFFMERRRFLEIMYDNIEDKSRIETSKRVASVQDLDAGALITATDGSQISCDIVAGADGVRSVVRDEIEAASPHLVKTPNNFVARYACMFGISTPVTGLLPGRNFTVYNHGVSGLVFVGLEGTLYWFVFEDLKQPVELGAGRRYMAKDVEALCAKLADVPVTDGVKFSDVFGAKKIAFKVPLEEGIADTWVSGRMFLLGDSAHKMTPHAAMGANQAIESVACFVSHLIQLRDRLGGNLSDGIPMSAIRQCLESYAERRRARATQTMQGANFMCRTQLKLEESFLVGLPDMTDEMVLKQAMGSLSQAEKIEHWVKEDSARAMHYEQAAAKVKAGA